MICIREDCETAAATAVRIVLDKGFTSISSESHLIFFYKGHMNSCVILKKCKILRIQAG